MEQDKTILTQAGVEKLKDELKDLLMKKDQQLLNK